jgi:4'-phosphopantetheinyl transferase
VTLEQNPLPGNLATRVRALVPPDQRLELFWCDLTLDARLADQLAGWLSPAEQARAARFGTDALRRRFVIGRATLRAVLARRLGCAPAEVTLARGRRGRPRLAQPGGELDFNVSHTGAVFVIGIGAGVTVGVDVERVDRRVNTAGIAQMCLTEGERSRLAPLCSDAARRDVLRLWTCKEAMSKATGDALAAPFRRLDVVLAPAPALRDGPAPYEPSRWTLHALDVPHDHYATAAVWTGRPDDQP